MRDEKAIEKARAQGYQYDFVLTLEEILADSEISIVVELMGRIEPAKTYITKVIKAGKNVVTANKDLLLFMELNCVLWQRNIMLLYIMKRLLLVGFQS